MIQLLFWREIRGMVAAAQGDTSAEPHFRLYAEVIECGIDSLTFQSDPWHGQAKLPYPFNEVTQVKTIYSIKYTAIKNHYEFGTGNLILIIRN